MRALVTGDTGFVGSYLVDFLSGKGVEVHGISRAPKAAIQRKRYRHHKTDLLDAAAVRSLVKKIRPDRIYHLAAQSSMSQSWKFPLETVSQNYSAQFNIFEAVKEERLKTRIHVASSSEVYGRISPKRFPVSESAPVDPVSPYGVSKGLQELSAGQYGKAFGVHAVVTRGFTHTGPGQRDIFVTPSFARQVARIEKGKAAPQIQVGNLEAVRDFTDVRDVVRAYWLALEKGKAGEVYNVCSGKGRRIAEILDAYLKLSRKRIRVKKDAARFRPQDVPAMIGDARKIGRLGWKPSIAFQKTLGDILEYWRAAE